MDIHEELLSQLPYPAVEYGGSALRGENPVVRLTSVAAEKVRAEMDRIHDLLGHARLSYQLNQKQNRGHD